MQIRVAQAAGIAVILLAAGCGTVSTSPNATADPPPAVAPPPDTAAPAPAPQPEPAPPPDTAAPAPAPQSEPAPPPDTAAPAPAPQPEPAPPPDTAAPAAAPQPEPAPPPDTAAPAAAPQPEPAPPPDTAAPAPAPQPEPAPPPDTAAPAAAPQPEPAPPPDTAAPAPAPVEGDAPRDVLVGLFAGLGTAAESSAAYEREDYEHDRAYLCDTSGVDPYTGLAFDASSCDVDHIVAAKEAHESGGHSWDVATRERFGNDALNLVASRDCVNRSKGSSDTAEWSEVQSGTCEGAQLTAAGRCFWAARTVAVKYRYDLAVDARELTALESGLNPVPPRHRHRSAAASDAHHNANHPPITTAATDQPRRQRRRVTAIPRTIRVCRISPATLSTAATSPPPSAPSASSKPASIPYRLDSDRDGQGCTG